MIRRLIGGLCAAFLAVGLGCGKKAALPANALGIAMGKDRVHLIPPEGLVDAYRDEPAAKAFADSLNPTGNTLEYFLVSPGDKAAFHDGRSPEMKRYALVFTLKPGLRERHIGTLDFQEAKQGLRQAFSDDTALAQRTRENAEAISKKFSEARGIDAKMDLAKPELVESWDMGMNGTGLLARSRVRVALGGRALSDTEAAMALHMIDLDGHLLILGLYGDDVTLTGLHGIRDQAKAWAKATQHANGDPWIIW